MPTPNLPITAYIFNFKACETINNTRFNASLWHGQLGRALRSIVHCVQPNTECKNCLLVNHCDYALLFYGAPPLATTVMKNYEKIPVPHLFQIPIEQVMQVQAGELFSVTLHLIGQTSHKLPLIIHAMQNIARLGLGKQRFKAELDSVSMIKARGEEVLVYSHQTLFSLPNFTPSLPSCPAFIRLQWLTPYRDNRIGYNKANQQLSIYKLLMAIIRRVSLLQRFYTDTSLDADFVQLKTLSQQAEQQCSPPSLFFSEHSRFSAKHQRRIDSSGVLGHLDLSLEGVTELWPYLFLGQFLNVGKNASMGYGRYKLLQIEQP